MKGYASTLVPPHHLKLEDAPPATCAALPKESPSVQSLQIYPPVNPAAFSGYPGPFGYPQQPFTPYPLFHYCTIYFSENSFCKNNAKLGPS